MPTPTNSYEFLMRRVPDSTPWLPAPDDLPIPTPTNSFEFMRVLSDPIWNRYPAKDTSTTTEADSLGNCPGGLSSDELPMPTPTNSFELISSIYES